MFLARLLSNKLSQLLVVSHSIFVVVVYATATPVASAMFYHARDEPIMFRVLTTLDYPAILVIGVIFWPISSADPSPAGTWVAIYYFALVAASTLQWLLVGLALSEFWHQTSFNRTR